MKNSFENFSIDISDEEKILIDLIATTAHNCQVDCYLIGGYVRDKILGRGVKDIDVMCVGNGIELAEKFAKVLKPSAAVHVFKRFGTAQVKTQNFDIEFVGARKESYAEHSRKPAVETGTLSDDLNRRDFTINTLAVSLQQKNFGALLDVFDGVEDLKNRKIKTPLNADITFSDDPLRMMRAIRFACQLQFEIDPETFDSIKRNKNRIEIISKERITDELNKILLSQKPSIGFNLLYNAGLLQIIFPEFVALEGAETKEGMGHKDNFHHTLQVIDNLAEKSDDLWLRWAAVLHDIGKPATKKFYEGEGWTFHGHEVVGARMVPQIFRKMKLPLNEKMHFVKKMVMMHLRPISLVNDRVTDSAIRRLLVEAGNDIESLMMLCSADITSKNKQKVMRHLRNFELVKIKLKEVEEKDRLRNWQPPIDGEHIMKEFSIGPCREVGIIKEAVREAILDGKIPNEYDAAFNLMLDLGKDLGLAPKKI